MAGEIDEIISKCTNSTRTIVRELRGIVKRKLPSVTELADTEEGIIVYTFEEGGSDVMCTIEPTDKGVNLNFINGALMADPDNILQGTDKASRFISINSLNDVRHPSVKRMLRIAHDAYKQDARLQQ